MKLSDVLLDGFGLENVINPKKSIKAYLNYKWLFIGGVIFALLLAIVYLFYTTPLYEISSKIVIEDREKGVNFSDNPLMEELDSYRSSKIIENEIEVFKSVKLMESVLKELDILTSLYSIDTFGRKKEFYKNNIPLLIHWTNKDWVYTPDDDEYIINVINNREYELSFDGKSSTHSFGEQINGHFGQFFIELNDKIIVDSLGSKNFSLYFNSAEGMARKYSQNLKVEPTNRQSSVLEISLHDNIPERGIKIIDNLILEYNFQTEEEKNKSASTAVSFLSTELNTLAMEIDSIENNIELLKKQNQVSDINTEARIYLEGSNEIKNQISSFGTQIQILESIQELLRNSSAEDNNTIPSSLTINDPALVGAIEKYNSLLREKQRLLRDMQPGNPLVISLNDRITSQKSSIIENLINFKSSIQIAIKNLEINSSRYEGMSSRIPQIERDLQEITRLRLTKLERFQYLSKKYEEAMMSLTGLSNSFLRVIDNAKASYEPVKPNKIIILLFAIVMGFGFPFMFVFVKTLFNNKIEGKTEAESLTGLPVIAEISSNESGEKLVFSENSRSPVAEQFRLLRSNLFSLNKGKDNAVILITSSTAGEGKTFCALNLGVSLSLIGKKVIVLEFDLRKPALLKALKVSKEKLGLVDYLSHENLKLEDIIKKKPNQDNLWYMGAGTLVENPAEIMSHPKLGRMIEELKNQFDYIVIDSSPVGMVPDAFSLCKHADINFYIIKSNYTTKEHLGFLSNYGVKEKLKNPMLIINGVSVLHGYGYGYDYAPELN